MWGYIVNFYKYATFPSVLKQNMNQYINDNFSQKSNSQSLMVFGDYDRLNIEKIDNFSRYRDVDPYAQRWLGPRQSLLLYQLPSKGNDLNAEDDILNRFCFSQGQDPKLLNFSKDDRNFLIFTMVTLDPRLYKYKDFRSVLEKCCQLIRKQVVCGDVSLIEPDQFSYQVYGSFSSAELIIAWSVNQYVDALRLIDMLRYVSFTYVQNEKEEYLLPFISLYSIVAQGKNVFGESHPHKQIQGTVELKISYQDGVRNETPLKDFLLQDLKTALGITEEEELKTIQYEGKRHVGVYDYSIRLPAYLLCDPYRNVFHRGGPLHWDQESVRKYISLTHVEFYYDMDTESDGASRPLSQSLHYQELSSIIETDTHTLAEHISLIHKMVYGSDSIGEYKGQKNQPQDDCFQITGKQIWEIYRNYGLRTVIKKMIPSTDGLCDSLDLLYSDFVHNCSNLTSSTWAEDLTIQFIAIIDYIANQFYRQGENGNKALFSNIKGVCEIYIHMIYHIAQSRRTIFVVPSCHLRYMGQYDMILHAYYGWIKCLLDLAYSLHYENGKQHILIPVMTIDVIPEIRTILYKVERNYMENGQMSYIFSINMPLAAMTDFLRYSMAMCHETAHFIIPHDRNRRNQVMGMLFFSELISNMILSPFVMDLVNDEVNQDIQEQYDYALSPIQRNFIAIIYNELRSYYLTTLHDPIMKKFQHQPESVPSWEDYRSVLFDTIWNSMCYPNNFKTAFDTLGKNCDAFVRAASAVINELVLRNDVDNMTKLSESFRKKILDRINEVLSNTVSTQIEKLVRSAKKLLLIDPKTLLYSESFCISDAYREACQDLFMIRVFQLSVPDYLVFLDRHRHDIGRLDSTISNMDALRISMVCDYLLAVEAGQDMPLSVAFALDRFDKCAEEYVNLFISVPEMRKDVEKDEKSCKTRLENCFLQARNSICEYYEHYEFVRELLLVQLQDSDILYDSVELTEKLKQSGMGYYYQEWKSTIMNLSVQVGQTKEEAELQMAHRIFKNNIAMIQQFQCQETLRALSSKLQGSVENDGKK